MRILFASIEWPFPNQPYRGPFAKSLADASGQYHEVIPLPLPVRRNPLNLFRYRKLIQRYFENFQCDHLHCYSLNTLLMAAPWKYPVTASAIGSDVLGMVGRYEKPTWGSRFLYKRIQKQLPYLEGIRSVSEELKQKLEKDGAEVPIEVIPDGIDLNRFPPKSREEACQALDWDPKVINVYFPGNPKRGVKNFPLAQNLIDQAREKYAVALYSFPGVSADQMNDYYRAADVVLITSIHEGSNNSLKEACLCNTPVLTTNVGDAAYWLSFDVTGAIFDPRIDPQKFMQYLVDFSTIKRKQVSPINENIAKSLDINVIAHQFSRFLEIQSSNGETPEPY